MSSLLKDFVYNNARSLFATAQLNWPASPIQAMLVNYLYAQSVDDLHVSDIPSDAIIVRDIALTGLGQTNGICYGNIPQFNSLFSLSPVVGVLLYSNLADDTLSPLIYYSSSGPGFPFAAQGFNYFVGFDTSAGGWFQA